MAFRPILRGAAHLEELELMDELPRHHRFQTRTDPFLEDTEGEFVDRYRLTNENKHETPQSCRQLPRDVYNKSYEWM